jgi:ribosomal-protein-alanine N-acetyltransferase
MRAPDTLRTRRLHARRIADGDLGYVVAVDTDEQMQATLTGRISSTAESQARLFRWIDEERTTGLGFWIFYDAENRAIGHGGLFNSPRTPGFIELGYAILPQFWGCGFATEIGIVLRDTAHALRLSALIAMTRTTNVPSRHVLEKCGFVYDCDVANNDILYARYVDGP